MMALAFNPRTWEAEGPECVAGRLRLQDLHIPSKGQQIVQGPGVHLIGDAHIVAAVVRQPDLTLLKLVIQPVGDLGGEAQLQGRSAPRLPALGGEGDHRIIPGVEFILKEDLSTVGIYKKDSTY